MLKRLSNIIRALLLFTGDEVILNGTEGIIQKVEEAEVSDEST